MAIALKFAPLYGQTSLNLQYLLAIIASTLILYVLSLSVYRLYISPLSRYPGPKLAALTNCYEMYYNLINKGGGQFTFHIKEMHERYGPVIRINPEELHIDDPDFYNEIYSNSSTSKPIDKTTKHKHRFNIPEATFSTVLAEDHRLRRAAIAPFFSKSRIINLNPNLQTITDRVSNRLKTEYAGTGRVFNISNMWSCMIADVITELAFGRSADFSTAPDFVSPFTAAMSNLAFSAHWNTHFRVIVETMNWVPDWLLGFMVPMFKPILDYRVATQNQLRDIISKSEDEGGKESSQPTIFHDIFSSHLPKKELSLKRLTDEATSVNGAGMETVTWTLTVACFHILDQPEVQRRLKAELTEAMPDADAILAWSELGKLPYLSAVISESLRLGYGAVQRLPRVNRLSTWTYQSTPIPAGIPVSMDAYHMHSNDQIFPSPSEFRPERWLGDPKGPDGIHNLSHYLVPFSRGSRACIGMHLAYMELYVALATLFRRHEFELFETDRTDVDFVNELVRPMPKWGSKGVRVVVKS